MFLQKRKQTLKLLKELKNKKLRKYKKKEKTSFLLNKRDSLSLSENQDKISLIIKRLLENENKNKELKNKL